jgi:hypothetical protein
MPPPIQQRIPLGAFQGMLDACGRSLMVAVTGSDALSPFDEACR